LNEVGFDTRLYEKRSRLGGGLIASAAPPGKGKIDRYRDYLIRKVAKSDVKVRLGATIDAPELIAERPDLVFVAAGTRRRPSDIEGIDGPNVLDSYQVLMGDQAHGLGPGQSALVYGGGETGCETAEYFADVGISVTLVTRSSEADLARSAEFVYRKVLLERLLQNERITVRAHTQVLKVDPTGAELRSADGTEFRITADRIVIAQGRDPQSDLVGQLTAAGVRCFAIGDSRMTGRIGDAVHDAYRALRALAAEKIRPFDLAC